MIHAEQAAQSDELRTRDEPHHPQPACVSPDERDSTADSTAVKAPQLGWRAEFSVVIFRWLNHSAKRKTSSPSKNFSKGYPSTVAWGKIVTGSVRLGFEARRIRRN